MKFLLLILFLPIMLWASPEGMTLDLNRPQFAEGIFWTEEGGVLQYEELFVQARNIRYDQHQKTLHCFDDLLLTYCGQVIIGKECFFDCTTKSGYITCARTAYGIWNIGAQRILLLSDGSLQCEGGYLTASEGDNPDLLFYATKIAIDPERRLHTSALQVKLYQKPLIVLPGFNLDLTHLQRPPIEVSFGWGGYLGPYTSLRYHALSYRDWKAFVRLDGFLKHGLGLGLETAYQNDPLFFYTGNYWAHDLAIDDPTKRDRYRFQGAFGHCIDSRTTMGALYDYVSDAQMAADYNHDAFSLNPAQETFLFVHHRENEFLANLDLRVRVNSFQSVDQQLPELEWHLHPITLPNSSLIFENRLQVGYINFVTSDQLEEQVHQQAFRLDLRPTVYYPLHSPYFSFLPKAGLIAIGYSNSPNHHSQNQILAHLSGEATTSLSSSRHAIIPHVRYTHLTSPTSSLDDHFIFTLEDGYIRFDELRFGVKQLFFFPFACQPLSVDVWANSFFDPKNHSPTLPKSYLDLDWQLLPTLFAHVGVGIHYGKSALDFFNSRLEWSLSERAAFSLEYRDRGSYAWRKADFDNFILDVARDESKLLDSPLSDPRWAFLASFFYRINPDWTLRWSSRYGKHQKQPRSYFEYEIDSSAMILDHWWLQFSYLHRESDDRFAFSLRLRR